MRLSNLGSCRLASLSLSSLFSVVGFISSLGEEIEENIRSLRRRREGEGRDVDAGEEAADEGFQEAAAGSAGGRQRSAA